MQSKIAKGLTYIQSNNSNLRPKFLETQVIDVQDFVKSSRGRPPQVPCNKIVEFKKSAPSFSSSSSKLDLLSTGKARMAHVGTKQYVRLRAGF